MAVVQTSETRDGISQIDISATRRNSRLAASTAPLAEQCLFRLIEIMRDRSSSLSLFVIVFLILFRFAASAASPIQERADRFLALANSGYQALYRVNSEAQWIAVTDVTPEHDAAAEATGKAYAAFNGNPAIVS